MAELSEEAVEALFGQQLAEWETARTNYAKLSRVEERKLTVNGSTIIVQYNPERLRSSAARWIEPLSSTDSASSASLTDLQSSSG